jgi:hypothetical protein
MSANARNMRANCDAIVSQVSRNCLAGISLLNALQIMMTRSASANGIHSELETGPSPVTASGNHCYRLVSPSRSQNVPAITPFQRQLECFL